MYSPTNASAHNMLKIQKCTKDFLSEENVPMSRLKKKLGKKTKLVFGHNQAELLFICCQMWAEQSLIFALLYFQKTFTPNIIGRKVKEE